jgi:methylglyoxal reductase
MKTRNLGASGIETPVIILGAWAFGGWYWGKANDEEAVAAIHRALDVGMTAIDTAPAYGMGHSEEVVGRALAGRRDRAIVMTKCGLRWDDDRGQFDFDMRMPDGQTHPLYRNLRPDSVRLECGRSLKRLQTDVVDLYQCHWPDPTTPIAETMGEMVKLHREGKIRAVGVSNFSPAQMDEARAALGDVPLASDQPRYNLRDRAIERDVLPYTREHGVGVIVYSPLDQGLLTGRMTEDRTFGKGDLRANRWTLSPENRRRVNAVIRESVIPIAERHGATPAQLAAAWTFHRPGVTAAIVGARSPAQVEENAAAGALELGPDETETLAAAFQNLELVRP